MDRTTLALGTTTALLLLICVGQAITISGLRGQLAAVPSDTPASIAIAAPPSTVDRAIIRSAKPIPVARDLTPDEISTLVREETQRAETERRTEAAAEWLANMRDKVEEFAIEEDISDADAEQIIAYIEDLTLTKTDLRRAIYEGDISTQQGRQDMKDFQAEHSARMIELLGPDGYKRLERQLGVPER